MNDVNLIGNLVEAPKLSYMPGGDNKAVSSFTIGVKRPYSKDKSDFHKIVVYSKQAESCAQYLDKGSKVAVNGYLTNRSYEAKDGGGKRYITEIVANSVEFLTPKGSKSDSGFEDMTPIDNGSIPF